MVIVNETVRITKDGGNMVLGVPTINSEEVSPEKCSWNCHHNTAYCKQKHTHVLAPWFSSIDPYYFGLIQALGSTGNYGLANLVFLVFLWPLLMYVLLIMALHKRRRIKALKDVA